jgi:hypothetical protein
VANFTPRKHLPKAKKPRADFPLIKHQRGYWCKKVRGRLIYFGKVENDPKGDAALADKKRPHSRTRSNSHRAEFAKRLKVEFSRKLPDLPVAGRRILRGLY